MPLPKILDIGFKSDEPKLWAQNIPIEEIEISEIEHNLDIPYLEKEGTNDWNLTPRMLLENFSKEKTHARRVKDSDLKYPLEIYKHKDKWIILDGVHRFTKAVWLNNKTIKVRKISEKIAKLNQRTPAEYKKWKGGELNKKLIIFDFDGVIADTMPDILKNSNLTAGKIGFSGISTQEMVRNLKEMSFEELGRAMGIPENMIKEFVKNILSFFGSQKSVLNIFPDMKETLKELAKNNFLSIITNNSRKAVDQFLLQNSLKDIFELIVDNDIPGSRKEKILSTQKHFDIAKENVYFIGDAMSDVKAAKEASVHSIAVAWGNQDPQMLKDSSPEFLINSPQEILEITNN